MKRFNKTAIATAVAHLTLGMGLAHAQAQTNADGTTVVVVTGQRAALQSAQQIKQNSDEIVDSVVAEDVGKLPDRSVAEVLQRVVGVSISRQRGEGFAVEATGVNIRGLGYVRTEINGREAFSSNGGRTISWSDVPPELMQAVDVYKNPSAEQIEGGISGLVNLRTALPFDFKGQRGALSVEETYSTLKKGKPDPSYSGLYSNRWKTGFGEFGALIDVAKSNSSTRTDSFQVEPYFPHTDFVPGQTVWIPKGLGYRTYTYDRTRQGLYGALQWKGERVRSHLTYFQSRYKDDSTEQSLFANGNVNNYQVSNATYDSHGALQTGTLSDPQDSGISFSAPTGYNNGGSKTTDISWNVEWKATDSLTFTSDLQYVKSRADHFASYVTNSLQLPSQTIDMRGSLPSIVFTDAQRAFIADPSNYYWFATSVHADQSKASLKSWKGDARYAFDHPVLRDVRFGVRLAKRQARTENSDPNWNWSAITAPWEIDPNNPGSRYDTGAILSDPRFSDSKFNVKSFPNFFNGDVAVPTAVFADPSVASGYPGSYQKLYSYAKILCEEKAAKNDRTCDLGPWAGGIKFGNPDNIAGINNQYETTKAFYTQLRFGFDDLKYPIDGNVGVRYVQTRGRASGYMVYTPTNPFSEGSTVSGVPVPDIPAYQNKSDVSNKYSNVLPTLNLRMKASDTLQFRLAFGKGMSRPDFGQLQQYTSLSRNVQYQYNNDTGVTNVTNVNLVGNANGNPYLRPTTSKQLDLTAEWYFAKSGSLTLALFDKRLKDIILNQTYGFALPDVNGKPQLFAVSGPINGAKGRARGGEIAYQQYFDNVPDWLKGIGMSANYTHVDSSRTLYSPVTGAYCSGNLNGSANLNATINGCDTDARTFGNLPLNDLSKHSFNLAFLYDRGPVSARLAWSWRSRALIGTGVNGTNGGSDALDTNPASPSYGQHNAPWALPQWADPYGQLDGGISYQVNDHFKVDLQAQNLTNARYKNSMTQGIGDKLRSVFASGQRYSVRAAYSF